MAVLTQFLSKTTVQFRQTDNTAGVNTTSGGDQGNRRLWTIAGNTVNSVNEIYAPATVVLAGGNTTTIDLSNSTANKNPVNAGLTFARTKGIYIHIANTTQTVNGTFVNGVLINGLAANSFSDCYKTIPAGGELYYLDPSANGTLVNSTSKNLVLKNLDATNSINVTVVVVGGRT